MIRTRRTCRLCDSSRIERSVPLASVPIVSPNVGTEHDATGRRLTQVVAPLDNHLCLDCGLIQLIHVVDSALIYRSYLYRTAISLGLAEHFGRLSQAVISRLEIRRDDLVVEFGSNDGTLLTYFREAGMRVQGIDPAEQIAAEATARGVPTQADFFSRKVAEGIVRGQGLAKAVLANNAMANIDDLAEILAGVKIVMAPDGVFVFETQYALDVFEGTLLDVIYHEHISTFSVQPVVQAFAAHGLAVFDAERIPTKGGSIRFWVQHTGGRRPVAARVAELIALEQRVGLYDMAYHARFGEKVARIKHELHRLIQTAGLDGGEIGAYGTSVGCAALIHQFGLEKRLAVLFDDKPFKDRVEGPGYDLPVFSAAGVYERRPALIVVLAWRYANPILKQHQRYIQEGGRFVVPLPDISTVP